MWAQELVVLCPYVSSPSSSNTVQTPIFKSFNDIALTEGLLHRGQGGNKFAQNSSCRARCSCVQISIYSGSKIMDFIRASRQKVHGFCLADRPATENHDVPRALENAQGSEPRVTTHEDVLCLTGETTDSSSNFRTRGEYGLDELEV